jgi:hypothetical protein
MQEVAPSRYKGLRVRTFVSGVVGLHIVILTTLEMGCKGTRPDSPGIVAPEPWFVDVTKERGLDFVHDAGPTGDFFMPQQVGSGAALFDFNNDGRLDILLLQNGGPQSQSTNRLFMQQEDGTFKDVSRGSGLDFAGWNMGVAVGDVNNDGWPDVLVTQYGGVRLFLNQRNNTFLDVTKEAGLSNPGWATSAAFFDYDRDGWLDLVVVNYVDYDPTWPCQGPYGKPDYCAPKTFKGRVSRLFHNQGGTIAAGGEVGATVPPARFQDVTVPSGLGHVPGPGLGVICADFDGDGWPDVFVANDGAPNRLWINQHNGTFKEESVQRGVAYNAMARVEAGMGVAYGDVDGDGLFDLFVTHLAEESHTLWKQGPRGLYQDQTAQAGLLNPRWRGTGFGTVLLDFDHDGALDLALVNGRVSATPGGADHSLGPFWNAYGDRNQIFANDGTGRFRDISEDNPPFCGTYNVARGLACGDFDNDGAQDLLVTSIAGPARLYRNVAPKKGHWLVVRAFDPLLQRDALGSEVQVRAGAKRWVRWMHPAESYLCSSQPRAHFGVGTAARVDGIEIVWPDGKREAFPGIDADRVVELRKGAGRPVEP